MDSPENHAEESADLDISQIGIDGQQAGYANPPANKDLSRDGSGKFLPRGMKRESVVVPETIYKLGLERMYRRLYSQASKPGKGSATARVALFNLISKHLQPELEADARAIAGAESAIDPRVLTLPDSAADLVNSQILGAGVILDRGDLRYPMNETERILYTVMILATGGKHRTADEERLFARVADAIEAANQAIREVMGDMIDDLFPRTDDDE